MKLHSERKFDAHLETIVAGPGVCFCGGGGGSSGPTTSTTNTSNLPEYLQPQVERNVGAAEATANQPYQAYGGQRIAGFNPNQQQTQGNIMGLQRPGQLGQASGILGGQNVQGAFAPGQGTLGGAVSGTQGIQQPTQFNNATGATMNAMGRDWTNPGTANQFMNPFQQNVTDIAKREAARQSNIQGTYDASKFGSQGAFGGYRQGVTDAERERNLMMQQQDIQSQGSNQAYQQGMQQFNTQGQQQMAGAGQLAGIGGQQFQTQLAQQQALAGMGTQQAGMAGQQLSAEQAQAQGLSGVAGQQQGMDLTRLGAQGAVGQQQQVLTQQSLEQQYQDFINQRDYQKQQANWMSGILHGTPYTAQSNVVQYQAPPNLGSQLTGLGIAGVGAYNAMNKAGS